MLRLEVREFRDVTRWRWVLTDAASGAFVADNEVRLERADWQFEAFADLPSYLRAYAAPDRREAEEARIVGEVGEWIGSRVLGAVGPVLVRRRPAVVRVVVPAGGEELLLRPLELAHVGGRPLAVQDVTLVMSAGAGESGLPGGSPDRTRTGGRLRVLGLFSLPDGRRALNLRRERQELVRLIEGIAATGKAADVRVLQYGVTRDAVRDLLADGDGWDIVHISGHGRPGSLLLETVAGGLDLVAGAELAELLEAGRGRVRLVTVAACSSAAVAGEQRRMLGLPADGRADDDSAYEDNAYRDSAYRDAAHEDNAHEDNADDDASRTADDAHGGNAHEDNAAGTSRADDDGTHGGSADGDGADGDRTHEDSPAGDEGHGGSGTAAGTLAMLLAGRLGCAVLAMRYLVNDEFAIALTGRLYDLLVAKGQPLARAVGMTLRELGADAVPGGPASEAQGQTALTRQAFPVLSMATPALFGDPAADLRLAAPDRAGPASYDTGLLKMAGFPPQPRRLVGRTGVMARASAALAARSEIPGVLLHGMPGGGKTACAIELAYGHEHAFDRLVWYKAPDEGMAIDGSLAGFALTLERYLPGFQMVHELVSPDRLTAFLPRLAELMERRRMLLVIDNAESLLTESGQWRDERWGRVAGALTGHTGLGRVILTSRRVPASLPGLRVEPVDALSVDEALLLIRELPNLQALGRGRVPGIAALTARQLARRAIDAAQGHPKLLELADGQAAHPDRLAALVEAGDQAWRRRGRLPEGFFAPGDGEPTATGADYLQVLAAWAKSAADTLMPGERDLFWFLCCLEERDRQRVNLEFTWADLWQELGRGGEPPDLDHALAAIAAAGLAAIREGPQDLAADILVHPGIAEAGRGDAGDWFRSVVDFEAAAYWQAMLEIAEGEAGPRQVRSGLLAHAALSGVPYMIRQQEWSGAAAMLEQALAVRPTRATAAAALPSVHAIAAHEPQAAGLLARALRIIDPAKAEAQLRAFLAEAIARDDPRTASAAAGQLAYLCVDSGRMTEALALCDQAIAYTRMAGLGPWSQLNDEIQRLQVLTAMGQADHVLAEARRLREHMRVLPDPAEADPDPDPDPEADDAADDDEVSTPWNVRELLAATARDAACYLRQWEAALGFNAEVIASKRDRSAPVADLAGTQFSDYLPLLRLGRTEEALGLVRECREVFEDAGDARSLGLAFSALADIEHERGHADTAVQLERDALRYKYLTEDIPGIALSYQHLGVYCARRGTAAIPYPTASAVIRVLADLGGTDVLLSYLASMLRLLGGDAVPARDIADLCGKAGDIPGTDLPGLLSRLSPDPEVAEQVLRDLIAQAQALAAGG